MNWISVKDQMPPIGKLIDILVLNSRGGVQVIDRLDYSCGLHKDKLTWQWCCNDNLVEDAGITHWIYVKDIPKPE